MNILICDDQKDDADKLAVLLHESGFFDIKTVPFASGRGLLEYIGTGAQADVCFLDIVMPEMNGVELAERLRSGGYNGEIVFLSISNDFAHQAFQVEAFDYLLKPPSPESIKAVLQKLEKKLKAADNSGFSVKVQGVSRFIRFRDISHIESGNHSVYIRLRNIGEIKVYAAFEDIKNELFGDSRFIQCHGSYMVNMSDIDTIIDGEIIMQNGMKVPVSRRFSTVRNEIMKWMFAPATEGINS